MNRVIERKLIIEIVYCFDMKRGLALFLIQKLWINVYNLNYKFKEDYKNMRPAIAGR